MLSYERLKRIAESDLCEEHHEDARCGVCDGILAARELLPLRWTPISPDNLPKVGDEVMRLQANRPIHVYAVHDENNSLVNCQARGDTHFRPINAPLSAPYGEGETK